MEVTVKFYRNNRKFQIVTSDHRILHTSGLCANSDSGIAKAKEVCKNNNWTPTRIGHY